MNRNTSVELSIPLTEVHAIRYRSVSVKFKGGTNKLLTNI